MAYDLKEDWEQTKQTIARLGRERKVNDSCQAWNPEMTDLVNTYKQEVVAWYNSPYITENGFQTTTQNLWYSHYLNKKRLHSLGLVARYDYIKTTDYERGENQRFPHWRYSHDGKNLICRISDAMRYRKSLFAGNSLVWSEEGGGRPGEYYIIQAKSMSGNCICPNCGREDTLEHLVDGCDYCGTKFQIGDFKQKVSSVYNPGSRTQKRSGFTFLKNFWPMYIILLLMFIGGQIVLGMLMSGASLFMENPEAFKITEILEQTGIVETLENMNLLEYLVILLVPAGILIGGLLIIIFLVVLLGKTTKESVKEGPAKTKNTLIQLRQVDPHFSEESFIGNLSNKLMSICYAESMEEIRPFAECDMTPFIQNYRTVVDCKLLECVLMDFQTKGEYQYLTVKLRLDLTLYENGRVGKAGTHLMLGLVKSIRAVTQSIHDVNVYHCNSCGRSLSLLNGGRCEYCGTRLNLKEYDWVIGQYEFLQG